LVCLIQGERMADLGNPTANGFMRLRSNPHGCRSGLMPMIIGIAIGWIFAGLWGFVACLTIQYSLIWAGLVGASTLAFGFVLYLLTLGLVQDAYRDYLLELNQTEAVLVVTDKLHKRKATQMVLLDDVEYAEYYPYTDSACLILHAKYCDMEVPLWPLGTRAQDVLDFLSGRGVRVVNVQFDDKIPA